LRAFVAGFFTTMNCAKPGTTNILLLFELLLADREERFDEGLHLTLGRAVRLELRDRLDEADVEQGRGMTDLIELLAAPWHVRGELRTG
jgi:hypothetical protein